MKPKRLCVSYPFTSDACKKLIILMEMTFSYGQTNLPEVKFSWVVNLKPVCNCSILEWSSNTVTMFDLYLTQCIGLHHQLNNTYRQDRDNWCQTTNTLRNTVDHVVLQGLQGELHDDPSTTAPLPATTSTLQNGPSNLYTKHCYRMTTTRPKIYAKLHHTNKYTV